MPGRSPITLLQVRGIRIGVDYSWFFLLFLVIIWLSSSYRTQLGANSSALGPYALAVASALLFFTSILLHELGHAFVALRNGIGISSITLWMFGGIARMERDADSPATEFKIAIAGPIVTAMIVAVCVGVGLALTGPSQFRDAVFPNGDTHSPGVVAMVAWLGLINSLVLVFNLIPALPLDGGRVARAIVWWRTGDRRGATRFAASLGQGLGMLIILVGIGLGVYSGDLFSAIWLTVIGLILRGSARAALLQSEFTQPIEGLHVADVMDREPVAIPAELSVEQALDEYFLRYRWPWFPVVDAAQRYVGLIDQGTANDVPAVERASARVNEKLARDTGALSVNEDDPLEAVLGNQALRRLGALVAVDADGRLRGVITADAIGRALRGTAPEG
jgi:Zn-dependent protease